jgi:hypothetical protein
LPLIVETLVLCALAFLLGFGACTALLKRRRRRSFLDYET